jgi:hypothetical protein
MPRPPFTGRGAAARFHGPRTAPVSVLLDHRGQQPHPRRVLGADGALDPPHHVAGNLGRRVDANHLQIGPCPRHTPHGQQLGDRRRQRCVRKVTGRFPLRAHARTGIERSDVHAHRMPAQGVRGAVGVQDDETGTEAVVGGKLQRGAQIGVLPRRWRRARPGRGRTVESSGSRGTAGRARRQGGGRSAAAAHRTRGGAGPRHRCRCSRDGRPTLRSPRCQSCFWTIRGSADSCASPGQNCAPRTVVAVRGGLLASSQLGSALTGHPVCR